MRELIRESIFGQTIRLVTKRNFLQYPEELDPSMWKQYIDYEKSGRPALRSVSLPARRASDEESEDERKRSVDAEKEGNDSETHSPTRTNQTDATTDPENGKDTLLVTWYGPNDPAVRDTSPTVAAATADFVPRTRKIGR